MAVSAWRAVVADPGAQRHVVQLYRDVGFLYDAVTGWIAPALISGGGGVILAEPVNAAVLRARFAAMPADVANAEAQGRLVILDANETLATFMVDGTPDAERFKSVIGSTIRRVREACASQSAPIRAWGEMVNVLRERGEGPAAKRIEILWNHMIDAENIRLLCSYALDNLSAAAYEGALRDVCHGHSQLLPDADMVAFDAALSQALVDVFGESEAAHVRMRYANQRPIPIGMPRAQVVLLELHARTPELGSKVLSATRDHLREAQQAR